MKRSYAKIAGPIVALAVALGLGACSRAQHVTGAVTAPGRNGPGTQINSGCPSLIANDPNSAFDVITESGTVAQFRSNRIRVDMIGDAAEIQLLAMGSCIATDIPTITVVAGHANMFVAGSGHSITTTGQRLTFGAMASPNVEPGVVLAADAQGNVFEIIWPELAGIGTGNPIVRVQLARWNLSAVNMNSKVDVTWDLTLEQAGVRTFLKGHAEGMGMDGTPVVNGGGAAIPPCPATIAGTSGATANILADIPQFRPGKRLRIEVTGDVAANAINAIGACAATDVATIHVVSGTGNVFRGGSNNSLTTSGQELTFGPLLSPGALVEPGIVLATDAAGNVLEIIWPALAGLPAGPPKLRLELVSWSSWVQTGRTVDVAMEFNVQGADGSTATFDVRANRIPVPVAQ